MEQNEVAVRWAKKGADVQEGDTHPVPADRTTKLIEDDAGIDTSGHAAPAVEDLVDENNGTVPADRASTREAIREEHGVNGEMCAKGYRHPPVPEAQKKRHRKTSNLRVRGEQIVGVMTKTMREGLKMSGSGRRRITAGSRAIESGVQPGPRRTDPAVEAGRRGVRIENPRKEETLKWQRRTEQESRGSPGARNQQMAPRNPNLGEMMFLASMSGV